MELTEQIEILQCEKAQLLSKVTELQGKQEHKNTEFALSKIFTNQYFNMLIIVAAQLERIQPSAPAAVNATSLRVVANALPSTAAIPLPPPTPSVDELLAEDFLPPPPPLPTFRRSGLPSSMPPVDAVAPLDDSVPPPPPPPLPTSRRGVLPSSIPQVDIAAPLDGDCVPPPPPLPLPTFRRGGVPSSLPPVDAVTPPSDDSVPPPPPPPLPTLKRVGLPPSIPAVDIAAPLESCVPPPPPLPILKRGIVAPPAAPPPMCFKVNPVVVKKPQQVPSLKMRGTES